MIYRTRTILFLILLVLFLIAAPITALYSLGWRFDWKTKKIIQPGIFYFKVWPKIVQIYLDGKPKKKTDLFFSSVLIENLKPQKYNVEIKKDGFHIWQKNLEIKKREVTEAKNIVLIPENPNFKILSKEVEDFYFSPDNKKIILKEGWLASRSSAEQSEDWALKLFEIDKNVKSYLISEKDISQEEVELFDLKFSPDSKTVLLELGLKEKTNYYLLEIDKTPATLVSLEFLQSPEQVFFNPKDVQKLFSLKNGELSEVDLIGKKISPLGFEDMSTFFVSDKDIYYLTHSGFLFKGAEKLNIIPIEIKKETKYELEVFGYNILLEENDILYLFNQEQKSFQKLFQPIKNFKFSPDWQKLVYANGHEIWVLFLEKNYNQPQKEKDEKLFITRFSEELGNIFWYTNHYLIFKTNDKIKIAEIDDRDKINIVDLAEFKSPEIFWANKKLYVLSEANLYVSEELTP